MKGQSELIGLVVVVMIISFGIILFLVFSANSEQNSLKKQYLDEQIVINFNDAILSTTSGYRNQEIAFLLDHCATYGSALRDGKTGCAIAQEIIEVILERTVTQWGILYEYRVAYIPRSGSEMKLIPTVSTQNSLTNKPSGCVVIEKVPSTFTLSSDNGAIKTYFDIVRCR